MFIVLASFWDTGDIIDLELGGGVDPLEGSGVAVCFTFELVEARDRDLAEAKVEDGAEITDVRIE